MYIYCQKIFKTRAKVVYQSPTQLKPTDATIIELNVPDADIPAEPDASTYDSNYTLTLMVDTEQKTKEVNGTLVQYYAFSYELQLKTNIQEELEKLRQLNSTNIQVINNQNTTIENINNQLLIAQSTIVDLQIAAMANNI